MSTELTDRIIYNFIYNHVKPRVPTKLGGVTEAAAAIHSAHLQSIKELEAENKRLKEERNEVSLEWFNEKQKAARYKEALEKYEAAYKQTMRQYSPHGNAVLKSEEGEYQVSFLYPANNKAFIMLSEAHEIANTALNEKV